VCIVILEHKCTSSSNLECVPISGRSRTRSVRYRQGKLDPGEQLPTVRALPSSSPSTQHRDQGVHRARAEGVLTTEQGTGTFVWLEIDFVCDSDERAAKLRDLCASFWATWPATVFPERGDQRDQDLVKEE